MDTSKISIAKDQSVWSPRMNLMNLSNSCQKHSFEVRCLTRDGVIVQYRTKFNGIKERHFSLMLVNKTAGTFSLTDQNGVKLIH